jgi:uncharacterized protein (DUF305 family)
MKNAHRIAAVLTTAALLLTACGGEDEPSTTTSVPASAKYNDADVEFATGMIQHHAQALTMVDMTTGRKLDPEFEQLAEQILGAQGPEIQTMTEWLEDWGQPVPETMRDHMHADEGSGMKGMDQMPGMMSDDELAQLESAGDAAFEEMWLEMMIEHHEGAIEMAQTELDDGEYPAATDLATGIVKAQEAEIEQMKTMLDG